MLASDRWSEGQGRIQVYDMAGQIGIRIHHIYTTEGGGAFYFVFLGEGWIEKGGYFLLFIIFCRLFFSGCLLDWIGLDWIGDLGNPHSLSMSYME